MDPESVSEIFECGALNQLDPKSALGCFFERATLNEMDPEVILDTLLNVKP